MRLEARRLFRRSQFGSFTITMRTSHRDCDDAAMTRNDSVSRDLRNTTCVAGWRVLAEAFIQRLSTRQSRKIRRGFANPCVSTRQSTDGIGWRAIAKILLAIERLSPSQQIIHNSSEHLLDLRAYCPPSSYQQRP
jgi:hypothetical protein